MPILALLLLVSCTKEIPEIPEGSVFYCDDKSLVDSEFKSCDVYNLGLICSDKETNRRQQQEVFKESWLLLNTEDQKILVYGIGFSYSGEKEEGNLWGTGLHDFTTDPESYSWKSEVVKKRSYRLYRENLEFNKYGSGWVEQMMCKLSSPEQVKLEIDSQKEFFLKKRKLKQEEQRLKDAEQLKANKI